jgi:hypothetical protein
MTYIDSVKVKDENNNIIQSNQNASGDYHLNTSFIQKIISSEKNSTFENLDKDEEFIGEADETYGISSQ